MLFSDRTVVESIDAAFKAAVLFSAQPLTVYPFTLHPVVQVKHIAIFIFLLTTGA